MADAATVSNHNVSEITDVSSVAMAPFPHFLH